MIKEFGHDQELTQAKSGSAYQLHNVVSSRIRIHADQRTNETEDWTEHAKVAVL